MKNTGSQWMARTNRQFQLENNNPIPTLHSIKKLDKNSANTRLNFSIKISRCYPRAPINTAQRALHKI